MTRGKAQWGRVVLTEQLVCFLSTQVGQPPLEEREPAAAFFVDVGEDEDAGCDHQGNHLTKQLQLEENGHDGHGDRHHRPIDRHDHRDQVERHRCCCRRRC